MCLNTELSYTHPHAMLTLLLVLFRATEALLPYQLQLLLGKLGAMLRGEGSKEEGRAGGQHGRIWMREPLGQTKVHGVLPMYGYGSLTADDRIHCRKIKREKRTNELKC